MSTETTVTAVETVALTAEELILSGNTGSMLDLLSDEERHAIVDPVVAKLTATEPEPTHLTCKACGETLPVSAFYRITKGGKFRQPCKNCYDKKYYNRDHGVRKPKTTQTETPTQPDAPVIETTPDETTPGQVEPVAEVTETPKKKGNRKGKVAPVKPEGETDTIHIAAA